MKNTNEREILYKTVQICSYKWKAKILAKCIFPKTEKVQKYM